MVGGRLGIGGGRGRSLVEGGRSLELDWSAIGGALVGHWWGVGWSFVGGWSVIGGWLAGQWWRIGRALVVCGR